MTVTQAPAPATSARSAWPWLVAAAAIGFGLLLWALSGFNPFAAPVLVLAMVAAASVAFLAPAHPAAACGLVFFVAIFERVSIETSVGALRVEQPAIAALVLSLVWHRDRLSWASLRAIALLIAFASAYLAVLTLSSLVAAVEPMQSLRVALWSAVSMAAGLATAILLRDRVKQIFPWLIGAVAFAAVVGLLLSLSFLLFGPWSTAIDSMRGGIARVFLPAYEPNLYANLLATGVPIALEQYRANPSRRNLLLAVLPLVALGLGGTRAAYIGLAVGLTVFLVFQLRHGGLTSRLRTVAATAAIAAVIGLVLPYALLNPAFAGVLRPPVVSNDGPRLPGQPPAQPPAGEQLEPLAELETWEYRMDRVRTALDDWRASPWIGLGAYSYGQRHQAANGAPEVIAVLPVLVLHDAGMVGLAALSAFLALLALRVWWTSGLREPAEATPAIALGSALVIMFVGYLSTAALHFAVTWILIGATIAAVWPRRSPTAHA